ncbi:nucleoside triphosphate pyrophosphohydrolase [Candidatus Venteria ishoeyi]|uniref:Nucleoside triphosphate pyrophosphohydrolase n=1 Tax=Candidatus Venteria ishoeyi TaxID=1899563 RepID=A0A1H6FGN9_9GAMM|nr:nucleoside triphosphate pyrophosphohydrolase [Candidatus Venteria ishoeyi]SEH09222.1 Nucleoside triphosphate pyrophosphohydrolase [Candidatus Venteria ishoeyi]SEH09347.1 Nucleoside triphosphate pyrophosphohydrolase [Candidatus Venteria ishoeyi]
MSSNTPPKSPVNPHDPRHSQALQRLLTIMNELREQCPWDRKQTFASLRHLTIEETYELADALLEKDSEEIRKELGDLMLHLVFYARIGAEQGQFDISDIINGVCDKLIARHPHVYGDVQADDEATVKRNWELLKLKEKGDKPGGVLDGVPKALPAMIKAWRIQQKVHGVGFDWDNAHQVWDKVNEELAEFSEHIDKAAQPTATEAASDEFGDILFSLINYARFVGIDPEAALEKTNLKFTRRFQTLEKNVAENGQQLSALDIDTLETYWQAAKAQETAE